MNLYAFLALTLAFLAGVLFTAGILYYAGARIPPSENSGG